MNPIFHSSVVFIGAPSRKLRLLALCALLLAAAVCLPHLLTRRAQAERTPALQGDAAIAQLKEQGLYGSLAEAMRAARYSVNPAPEAKRAFQADNPAQRLSAHFTADGLRLRPANDHQSWSLGMKLRGVGYGERFFGVASGELSTHGNRVEIHHQSQIPNLKSQIVEWYVNKPDGLEQGFTLNQAPGERRAGERLQLALKLDGDLRAQAVDEGQAIELRRANGAMVMRYDHLVAVDARGRQLPSAMRVAGGEVWLEVDDAEASYPVTIDPLFTQLIRLTGVGVGAGEEFGRSVATSGDTVVAGTPGDDTDRGSAFVFVRSGMGYSLQQQLVGDGRNIGDTFDTSVAISGDTIVVGAEGEESKRGAAYVFVRSGGSWSRQQRLVPCERQANDQIGFSAAIDGDRVVIGAPLDDVNNRLDQGSAYIFERSGATWSQKFMLAVVSGAAGDRFGLSVAISGETVVAGAPLDDIGANQAQGAAYVFVRSGAGYIFQQKLVANDGTAGDEFGGSVAISGGTIVIGADSKSLGFGAAYVFVRSGVSWSQQQKLTANDGRNGDNFGVSVAIDGDTTVIGARGSDIGNPNQGVAYVFVRSGASWSLQQRLIASDGGRDSNFGNAVAISGETVVVGAEHDDIGVNGSQGSVYVFVRSGATWSEQQKLVARDGEGSDLFGNAVAISGDTVVVGAYADDFGNINDHRRSKSDGRASRAHRLRLRRQLCRKHAGDRIHRGRVRQRVGEVHRGGDDAALADHTCRDQGQRARQSGDGTLRAALFRLAHPDQFPGPARHGCWQGAGNGHPRRRDGRRHRSSLGTVSVKIGGVNADALYAGPQGAFVGLDQLNVSLPRSLAGRGEVEVSVSVDGAAANLLKVAIK